MIEGVLKDSILDEMEISAGDILLSINGSPVNDILDYRFLIPEEELYIEIEKVNGEIWEIEVEKDFDEDLGLLFQEEMLETKTCKNNCVFCFIDQLPKGMRESLYVKDDDERLSFLTGNYITMTNLTKEELDRIIRYHIMPINVSIHTTNPELRCKMLNNRFAGEALEVLKVLKENNIQMNGQIVLVPGYNDGQALLQTITDLKEFYPVLQSLSVVPVGLSKHREGLPEIKSFTKEKARDTLDIIEKAHREMKAIHGEGFIYPGDEFYLMAEVNIPEASYYDDFPQIENGVGMMADFKESFERSLEKLELNNESQLLKMGIITGIAAFDYMKNRMDDLKVKMPKLDVEVYPIVNEFFGEQINVSGLVTGKDIISQLQGKSESRDLFLIPQNMLRSGTTTFLDDLTLEFLEKELHSKFVECPVEGEALIKKIIKEVK